MQKNANFAVFGELIMCAKYTFIKVSFRPANSHKESESFDDFCEIIVNLSNPLENKV